MYVYVYVYVYVYKCMGRRCLHGSGSGGAWLGARRQDLYTSVFGAGSLFGDGLDDLFASGDVAAPPVAPGETSIVLLRGLPGAGWASAREPAPGGLRNPGFACYAISVAQVLLRLPAVSAWLEAHVQKLLVMMGQR